MATSRVVVHLADLDAIQKLVVAAAGVLDSLFINLLRLPAEPGTDPHLLVGRAALLELLAALEALETAKS